MHVGSPPPPLAGPSPLSQAGIRSLPEKLRAAFPADLLPAIESAPLSIEDRKYVSGENRLTAQRLPAYANRFDLACQEVRRWYSPHQAFRPISPSEANTSAKSWQTVLSGLRPIGQFSVKTPFSPLLHALLALDNIDARIYRKELPEELFIVVIYRRDAPDGEARARRLVELCGEKQQVSRETPGSAVARSIASERQVARETGALLNYDAASIDAYMQRLRWPQTMDPIWMTLLSRSGTPVSFPPGYRPAE